MFVFFGKDDFGLGNAPVNGEGAVAWNDPTLAIDWRIPKSEVILSEKDKHHPFLYEQ